MKSVYWWGIKWRFDWGEALLGPSYDNGLRLGMEKPLVFRTRRQAREWIEKNFGYIKRRPDLKAPPYNWRLPWPVKVYITEHENG